VKIELKLKRMKERKNGKRVFKAVAVCLWLTGLLIATFSCDKYTFEPPTIDPGEEVSFSEDILKFIEDENCAGCHPRVSPPDLTEGKIYESLLDGYVDTESPENSKIYTQFEDGHVGFNTESIEIQKILNWIKQGAKNN
jgi:hypothetical protein